MNRSDCVFCKIIKGEVPSFKIYEEKDYYAFLDISQFSEGHTLVVPKKHIEFIWDSDNIDKYFIVNQKIANHFKMLGFKYVDVLIFGRKVPHAHVHLIPHNNKKGDYYKALKKLGEMQENSQRKINSVKGNKIAKKFKL